MGENISGLTIQLVFGRWGGIHAGLLEHSFHVTVGWISFQIWFLDMDKYIERLQDGFQHVYNMCEYWHKKYQSTQKESEE